jgi:sec-independent protein translocase protein TatA
MPFQNLGFGEIMLLVVVVLLLFGAKRLPEIGASMGKGIREFKRSISDVDKAINEGDRGDRLASRERDRDPLPRSEPEEDRPEPKRLLS